MNGKSFAKMSRDANLLDPKLSGTDVDLTFAKIKTKTGRRITFIQFLDGLNIFAQKKGVGVDEINQRVLECSGPVLSGTKAEANKFHDDKSLYTGMHAPPGSLLSRTESRKFQRMGTIMTPDGKEADSDFLEAHFGDALKRTFEDYCDNPGGDSMDGKSFTKLAKDCDLLDATLTATDVDIAFAKVKKHDTRRITYLQFLEGLVMLASKKKMSLEEITSKVKASLGPILMGTVAEANKFHDDKSLYTGVHARGGPSIVDDSGAVDLSKHLDRSPSDIRGVKDIKTDTGFRALWATLSQEEGDRTQCLDHLD
eukprot:CAMPEP_0202830816 /NCGR_PEP_ID=MMETSP1389-20130828/16420_1 /ASSEMBLY_ACC=CAM_ASM_000865 /TAXON_ID=302021 /ORGANISM="Rhodomonas sp., Strain CCMP768" /LENGTH=310 /DNA_ID=CAMNT_0049504489 /DNA_START=51 /DNA_END=984 /DNA_ORIENTATION=+